MTDMTLEEAIAKVKSVSGDAKTWDGWDFCGAEKSPFDDAIATILNAVASGDLIPASDAKPAVLVRAAHIAANQLSLQTDVWADDLRAAIAAAEAPRVTAGSPLNEGDGSIVVGKVKNE